MQKGWGSMLRKEKKTWFEGESLSSVMNNLSVETKSILCYRIYMKLQGLLDWW